MIGVARRRCMGGGGVKELRLKYWLSGEDAPVNNTWVDRLNPSIAWTLGSAVTHDAVNNRYQILGRTNANGVCTLADGYMKYDLGYHFKMIIQGTLINDQPNSNGGYLIDFASVVGVSSNYKAVGWSCSTGQWVTNYKLTGNNSGTLYNPSATGSLPNPVTLPYDFTVEFGSEAVSASTSRMYVLFNGNYYYGPEYSNISIDNLNHLPFIIGRGYAGQAYGQDFYLNDWKIYVES